MQPTQNKYLNILTQFNPQIHYLKIDENHKPVLCNKSALTWSSRITRWFWKPENERITQVSRQVFAHLGDNIFQQLNGNEQGLTRVFSHLGYLSERADRKMGYNAFKSQTFTLQNVNFGKLAVQKEANQIKLTLQESVDLLDKIKIRQESALKELEQSLAQKNADLQTQIEEVATLIKENEAFRLKNETIQIDLQTKKKLLSKINQIVETLELKRLYLQSNTVLWAEDGGYALCHSSCFSSESILNCSQFDNMSKLSPQVEARLQTLQESEEEKSKILRSLPKHVYIPNAQSKHLKMLLAIVELGPDAIEGYTDEEHESMCAIADYLLQPSPNAETSKLKQLRQEIKDATEFHHQKLNSLKHQLNQKKQKISQIRGLILQLRARK